MTSAPSAAGPWRVDLLPLHARTIEPASACGTAYEALAADPTLPGMAVLERGRIVGLIDRHSLLSTFARPVIRDVYERRPVSLLMDRKPLIVDVSMPLSELSELIGRDKPSALMSGFVVTREGRFAGIGTVLDILRLQIEEGRQRSAELEAARAEAERADMAKTQFLANMSHELRTPLNAIIGFGDIIQGEMFGAGPEAWARYRDYAADIGQSGRLLLQLVTDILDLSKAAAGKVELREDVVRVDDLVEAVIHLVHQGAEQAGLNLRIRRPDHTASLWGDELKLKQVLLNFVSNAIKFTPSGGTVEILAGGREDGGYELAVRDTGIGIAEEHLARIFEPFTQVDSALGRRHNGTGLGLPLARNFVELHGGRVEIASTPGVGTRIVAILPPDRVHLADRAREAGTAAR